MKLGRMIWHDAQGTPAAFDAKRILVPVDFSPQSELALDWAVRMAKGDPDRTIELCHVLPHLMAPMGPEAYSTDYTALFEEEKKAVLKKLKALQMRIPGDVASCYRVCEGRIAEEIERLCQANAIDLVVMTTHGRKGLSRFLHGSTTEETVRRAPCPVLVLHLNPVMKEAVRNP